MFVIYKSVNDDTVFITTVENEKVFILEWGKYYDFEEDFDRFECSDVAVQLNSKIGVWRTD